MDYTVTSSDDGNHMTIGGELTIEHAGELRDILLSSIEDTDLLTVALQDVASVDLSTLQLFCSAHRTAVGKKKRFVLNRSGSQVFDQAVEDAGYGRHEGCVLDLDESCIWRKEKNGN